MAPKKRQSVNEKYDLTELNIEITEYIKPPMKKLEIKVPIRANAKMAPKFLKK